MPFSFNEVWTKENERKATIKTVIIKEQEQFNKVDKYGDIRENNEKVEILNSPDSEKGPDIRILNHIWSTSIDNVVIEEEYTPDGCWRNQSNPIVFCGLGPQAYDGDLSTHHGGKGGVVTWKGNLAGKKVFIKKTNTSESAYSEHNYFMYVKDKDGKNIDFLNLDTGKVINVFPRTTSTMNILVPENAESFYFSNGVVYEIQVDSVKNPKSVYDVTSTVEDTSVTLNWKQNESDYEKSLIYRNDELIAIVNGHSYKDPSLYADTEYKYEIYAMNKYGNINLTKITHHVKTTKPKIIFKGLGPESFDGNLSTHHGGKGGTVTWEGDLAGKKVLVKKSHTSSSASSSYNYFMYVKDKDGKNIQFLNLDTGKFISSMPRTTSTMNILVPENAESFYFSNGVVYEVQVNNIKMPESVYDVTSIVNNTNVTLNWKQNESDYGKSLIYRNNELIAIVNGHSYKDPSLYADTKYEYKIYAMNKYGNVDLIGVNHNIKTTRPEIVFKGLGPESFDGNLSTHHGGKGGTATWEGDLAGKKVLIKKSHTSSSASSSYNYFMYVRDKDGKNIQFLNLDTNKIISSMPRTTSTMNILVPENAESFYFSNGVVYEIQVVN